MTLPIRPTQDDVGDTTTRVMAQRILDDEWLHWDLRPTDLSITEKLSGAQVISGTFPTEISDMDDLDLEPWATWIHVEEQGVIRASGILLPASVNADQTLTFDAIGISGYAKGTVYTGNFTLSGIDPESGEGGIGVGLDPADIVRNIWAHLQSHSDAQLGVTVTGTTPIRRGTPPREVDFTTGEGEHVQFIAGPYSALDWWEAKDCGSEIDSLADETPFDYIERQQWRADFSGVDHWIEIHYPRLGSRQYGVRFAEDENIIAAIGPEEPDDRYASEVIVLGQGEGATRVRGYAGRPLSTRLRRVAVIDDKSMKSTTEANNRARIELELRQALTDIPELQALARHPNATLGAFSIGDEVLVEADVPWWGELRLWQRVLSITYAPESEHMKLTMRSASSFIYGGQEPSDIWLTLGALTAEVSGPTAAITT